MRSILFLVSAFLLLSCAGCGEERTVCLTVRETDFQISDARGKALTYDGEFSGEMEPVSQSYLAGAVKNSYVALDLEVGSGTLDFSPVADGELLVTENGREGRTVSA